MLRLVDSHAHIYLDAFDNDREEMIDRAKEAGVERIYMPNIDHTTIDRMLEVAERHKGFCIPMMGLHPCSVDKNFEKELYLVEDWLNKSQAFVAVGELGTDLYWDTTYFEEQKEAFRIQSELALKNDLPIVIHCRNSIDETIELVSLFKDKKLKGVFHCFTGDTNQLKKVIGFGYHVGFGGVSTFKNGGLEDVIAESPMDRILLETDCPYLAPVPYRGKRNEPAFLKEIALKIAGIKNQEVEKIGEIAIENTRSLFESH